MKPIALSRLPFLRLLRAQDERRKPIALSLSKGCFALRMNGKSLDLIRANLRKSAVKKSLIPLFAFRLLRAQDERRNPIALSLSKGCFALKVNGKQ